MSTRCQVQVVDTGEGNHRDRLTLYHHTDGYPEGIVPLIRKAFDMATRKENHPWGPVDYGWTSGRAGKVAGYLCAADPGVFEPESGHELHGDIEYFYRVTVATGDWKLEVFEPGKDWDWDNPTEKDLTLIDTIKVQDFVPA